MMVNIPVKPLPHHQNLKINQSGATARNVRHLYLDIWTRTLRKRIPTLLHGSRGFDRAAMANHTITCLGNHRLVASWPAILRGTGTVTGRAFSGGKGEQFVTNGGVIRRLLLMQVVPRYLWWKESMMDLIYMEVMITCKNVHKSPIKVNIITLLKDVQYIQLFYI